MKHLMLFLIFLVSVFLYSSCGDSKISEIKDFLEGILAKNSISKAEYEFLDFKLTGLNMEEVTEIFGTTNDVWSADYVYPETEEEAKTTRAERWHYHYPKFIIAIEFNVNNNVLYSWIEKYAPSNRNKYKIKLKFNPEKTVDVHENDANKNTDVSKDKPQKKPEKVDETSGKDTGKNTDAPKDEPKSEPEKLPETPENKPLLSEIKIQNEFHSSVHKATKIMIVDTGHPENKKVITDKKLIKGLIANFLLHENEAGDVDCWVYDISVKFYNRKEFLNAFFIGYAVVSIYKKSWKDELSIITDESAKYIRKWIADTGFKLTEDEFPSD